MEPYKWSLEKGRSCYECPKCSKKEFTRYVYTATNQHIHSSVGRCSRIIRCKHHYTPGQYFSDNPSARTTSQKNYAPKTSLSLTSFNKEIPKPVSYINLTVLKNSCQDYSQNRFLKYLENMFGAEQTDLLIKKYYIGNSSYWPGATIFWYIDINGNIRTGKVMLYNPDTGKRTRDKNPTWVHAILKLEKDAYNQCLFGEHLLNGNNHPVAIVESEKTAIIANLYLPQFIWLACGGLTNLSADKYKVLQGRKVVLFPDLNGYEQWTAKANEMSLSLISKVTVSQYLLQIATDEQKQHGLDIADYLVEINPKKVDTPVRENPEPDLLRKLVAECAAMSKKFSSVEITHAEYADYSKQLSGKLSAANISYQMFVDRTKNL